MASDSRQPSHCSGSWKSTAFEPTVSNHGTTGKISRADSGWLMAAKAHAMRETKKKGLKSAGGARLLAGTSLEVEVWKRKKLQERSDYLASLEQDDLVVSGGSLNIMRVHNHLRDVPTVSDDMSFSASNAPSEDISQDQGEAAEMLSFNEQDFFTSKHKRDPSPDIQMFESPDFPFVMVVHRSDDAKMKNPSKLTLDHCNLKECCILEGEEELRLLNYEHNQIGKISNLEGLRHLVFLDLFSNCLEYISGLECLPNLKYLLLGRNYIRQVKNLKNLNMLDVLDLHDNLLDTADGFDDLVNLRVLNLAGNRISRLHQLVHLSGLVELNLKRNFLLSLHPVDVPANSSGSSPCIPESLKFLFLSHNKIASFAALQPLTHVSGLQELSLDGNPLATSLPMQSYREHIMELCASNIKVLDAQMIDADSCNPKGQIPQNLPNNSFQLDSQVTYLERANDAPYVSSKTLENKEAVATSIAVQDEHNIPQSCNVQESLVTDMDEKQCQTGSKRPSIPSRAEKQLLLGQPLVTEAEWNDPVHFSLAPVTSLDGRLASVELENQNNAEAISVNPSPSNTERVSQKTDPARSLEGGTSNYPVPLQERRRSSMAAASVAQRSGDSYRHTLQRGYLSKSIENRKAASTTQEGQGVVELQDGHRLCLYGNVLYALNNHSSALVTDVCIKYLGWKTISESVSRLAGLSRLRKLVFEHNRLEALEQLECLKSLTRLQSLSIQFNPVVNLVLFRPYVGFKLPQVRVLNGGQISEVERAQGKRLFLPIQDALRKQASCGEQSAREPSTVPNVQRYVSELLCSAMAAERRISKLDCIWDLIVTEFLQEGHHQAQEIVQYYDSDPGVLCCENEA